MEKTITARDEQYEEEKEKYLQKLGKAVPLSYVADNFAKYVSRKELTRFLVRHELFKQILDIKGSIVECGVLGGNGVMGWAQLSAIMEPVAYHRRVYGFDTFEGFPSVHARDLEANSYASGDKAYLKKGFMKDDSYADLQQAIHLHDLNRFLPQIAKTFLVKGDFMKTADDFIKANPHLIVALLYLDFDLYEPTKKALELFLPRMPKGSIIGFDEINNPKWPGETSALLEMLKLRDIRIQKFPYEPNMAYVVL